MSHGASAGPGGLFDALVARYGEPHRAYHNLTHIEECFRTLDLVAHRAERLGEIEMALWFHDAIYDTRSHTNEADSAAWARRALTDAGVRDDGVARIEALVLATSHAAAPVTPDARITVDVDLSILGAPRERFDAYEDQIRREYDWVPDADFRAGRGRVLRGFLARPFVFSTQELRDRLESRARRNLELALSRRA